MWGRRASPSGDPGIAMISVIGIGAVVFILLGVIAVRVQSDHNQVLDDRVWQRALDVGEAGVDYTLKRLGEDPGYVYPAGMDPCPQKDSESERDCILREARRSDVETSETFSPVPGGEWVHLKPDGAKELYAVGFVPSRDASEKVRILRVEYDFRTGFTPDVALLTDDDLHLTGDATLQGDNGSAHANGDLYKDSSGLSASGSLTATGQCLGSHPDPCEPNQPKKVVPRVNPRDHWQRSQYDLCDDSTVRPGPGHPNDSLASTAGSAPCESTEILATPTGAPTEGSRGWYTDGTDTSQGTLWYRDSKERDHGVYYVYRGSAFISGQAGTSDNPWLTTILAEADPTSGSEPNCPHTGGDIDISGQVKVRYHDRTAPFITVAGRDLLVSGKAESDPTFTGALVTHEQFLVEGNPKITGTIIAEEACDTDGSPVSRSEVAGDATITYNGDLELPFGETIRITHWLEL